MERIEVSTANINLSDLAKQVSRDRVSVELFEGQVPLARIVPIEKPHSMADLDQALREIPRLGEDAAAFDRDVQAVRKSLGALDDPWES